MRWLQIKKIAILKCCLLLFCATQTNCFLIGLWCAAKSQFYTTGDDQLGGWTEKKHFPKPDLHPKKSWSLFGGLLQVWSTTDFWILAKTSISEKYVQQINEMHWKLQCLQPALVNRMGPVLLHNNALTLCPTTNASKVKWIGLWCFCLHHFHLTSHQSTTTSSSISTTFCRENASTTIRMQKMLSKSSSNLKAQIFMLEE